MNNNEIKSKNNLKKKNKIPDEIEIIWVNI
jgi:hypothetical protein